MKEVLIISYYFPPLGMGGVQRVAKWVKYLHYLGWKCRIVTVRDVEYYAKDYSLLNDTKWACVYRTESFDPLRLVSLFKRIFKSKKDLKKKSENENKGRFFRKFLNYWLIPDVRILWLPFVFIAACKIIKRNKAIKSVITSSPPNSSHLIGFLIKKQFGLSWIADLRDDWVFEVDNRSPTNFHKLLNKYILRNILSEADRITAVSDTIAKRHMEFLKCDKEKILTIRNGFDPEDFKNVKPEFEDKFTIVYNGSITSYTDPTNFLKGAALACRRNRYLKKDLLIKFIGSVIDVDLDRLTKETNLTVNVKIYGYKEHQESINILSGADIALLLISKNLGKGMVTGKIYEYFAAKKYILALIPKCDAADLLIQYGNASLIDPDNLTLISAELENLYSKWKNGENILNVEAINVERFNRALQVKKLSGLLKM